MLNGIESPRFDRFKRLSDTRLLGNQKLLKWLSRYRLLHKIWLCAQ